MRVKGLKSEMSVVKFVPGVNIGAELIAESTAASFLSFGVEVLTREQPSLETARPIQRLFLLRDFGEKPCCHCHRG